MVIEAKLALRYLVSSRLQTVMLLAGVSIGVVVYTFIAALMNGLGLRLTHDVSGNVAHITLEPALRTPQQFMRPLAGRALFAVQPGHDVKAVIGDYQAVLKIAMSVPGVRAAVAEVVGNATLVRGAKDISVAVIGLAPRDADTIAPLSASMVRGTLDLSVGSVLVGSTLASDLAVDVGDRLILRASRVQAGGSSSMAEVVVHVRGIFTLGLQAMDERVAYLDLGHAKKLFAIPNGVSTIEVKVDDVWQAQSLGARLGRATQLKSSNWLDRNTSLQAGLRAQGTTSSLIKGFSLLTIAIGVASALYLSVSRRRSEIGILRSFGIRRRFIVETFVLQGLFIGVGGAVSGALLGYAFSKVLLAYSTHSVGAPVIPIDPSQGEYLRAIVLASIASALAAVLPAYAAARIDPLEAIQS
jgi:lipoprotein-releasing system permease protein